MTSATFIMGVLLLIPYALRFMPGTWLVAHKKLYWASCWVNTLTILVSFAGLAKMIQADGFSLQYLVSIVLITLGGTYIHLRAKDYATEYDDIPIYGIGLACTVAALFI